ADQQLWALADSRYALCSLGLMFESRRQFARADSLFAAGQRVNPGSQTAAADRADNLANLGRHSDGIAAIDDWGKRNPSGSSRAVVAMAHAFLPMTTGDYPRAERTLDSLVHGQDQALNTAAYSLLWAAVAVQGRLSDTHARLASWSASLPAAPPRAPASRALPPFLSARTA